MNSEDMPSLSLPSSDPGQEAELAEMLPSASVSSDESASVTLETHSGENGEPTPACILTEKGEALVQTSTPHGAKKRSKKRGKGAQKSESFARFRRGDVVFGKITSITEDVVRVDLLGKGIALFDRKELDLPEETPDLSLPLSPPVDGVELPASEVLSVQQDSFERPEGVVSSIHEEVSTPLMSLPVFLPPVVLEVGAPFVGRIHNDGGWGGSIVLTRHPKRVQQAKQIVAGAFQEQGVVSGLVTGVIKGGVEVDIEGLRAFCPASHMSLRFGEGADLSLLVGQRLPFSVIQYAKQGGDVVLSRRTLLEKEEKAHREKLVAHMEVGSSVEGVVVKITPFGVFVDLGGIWGLVPCEELSHVRGDSPEALMPLGERVQVKFLHIDEKGKIWLSRKALISDPWAEMTSAYKIGSKHTGVVVRVENFGAFVQLAPGVDGLLGLSDLSLKRVAHPSELLKVGDTVEVVVAKLDPANRQISLHPVLIGAHAEEEPQYPRVNKGIKGMVCMADDQGLLVRLCGVTGRFARGFVQARNTGMPRGSDLRKAFPVNTKVEAKILSIDPQTGESELSIQAFEQDHERATYRQYQKQVIKETRFTFGDLLEHNKSKKS